MRVSITAFVTFCLVSASASVSSTEVNENSLEGLFQSWAVQHGRNYADKEEHESRRAIWMDNHGTSFIASLLYSCRKYHS